MKEIVYTVHVLVLHAYSYLCISNVRFDSAPAHANTNSLGYSKSSCNYSFLLSMICTMYVILACNHSYFSATIILKDAVIYLESLQESSW